MEKKKIGAMAVLLFIAGGILLLLSAFLFVSGMLEGRLIPVRAQVCNVGYTPDVFDRQKMVDSVTVSFRTEEGEFTLAILPDHKPNYSIGQWLDIYYSEKDPSNVKFSRVDPVLKIVCPALAAVSIGFGIFMAVRNKNSETAGE